MDKEPKGHIPFQVDEIGQVPQFVDRETPQEVVSAVCHALEAYQVLLQKRLEVRELLSTTNEYGLNKVLLNVMDPLEAALRSINGGLREMGQSQTLEEIEREVIRIHRSSQI